MSAVPLHAEATADPQTVHWVVPSGSVQVLGEVVAAPGDLGGLLADGTLRTVTVRATGIDIVLADGCAWREYGARVGASLAQALLEPAGWRAQREVGADDELRAAVDEVLEGPAGDYIRSHGGYAEVISAHDGRVELRLSGTCSHCPAAGITLHERLEGEIRALAPGLRELTAHETPGARERVLLSIGRRRAG
ncbi:NifU family protein [Allobranchiibius sp. GilTou73]|uniref:NifU family protein n=1 Tax=Allobranchiibius sp. GilTou73 TaxID=2904523 RepID=UPI001F37995A|nr:NifU family protein [Allobranchiibius sp. GilTou73]UIJ35363.1 NifU family protein [Allobranchiibius sp. GilTou73]